MNITRVVHGFGRQSGSAGSYLAIVVAGALALVYLTVVWRAAYLHARVSAVDEGLATAQLALECARSEFLQTITPEALGAGLQDAPAEPRREPAIEVSCPELPPLEMSVLLELGGHDGEEPVEKPTRPVLAEVPRAW